LSIFAVHHAHAGANKTCQAKIARLYSYGFAQKYAMPEAVDSAIGKLFHWHCTARYILIDIFSIRLKLSLIAKNIPGAQEMAIEMNLLSFHKFPLCKDFIKFQK
jgi:hypothetical protein